MIGWQVETGLSGFWATETEKPILEVGFAMAIARCQQGYLLVFTQRAIVSRNSRYNEQLADL